MNISKRNTKSVKLVISIREVELFFGLFFLFIFRFTLSHKQTELQTRKEIKIRKKQRKTK